MEFYKNVNAIADVIALSPSPVPMQLAQTGQSKQVTIAAKISISWK